LHCLAYVTFGVVDYEEDRVLYVFPPTATLELEFEEEGGWGGTIVYTNGCEETTEEYNDKCRQCGALDQMEMCETCENYLCTKCNYGSFVDEDTLKECEVHKDIAKEVSA